MPEPCTPIEGLGHEARRDARLAGQLLRRRGARDITVSAMVSASV